MDYQDILSGIATPDMGEVTTVTNHNLNFYFDDFDDDDFPPDDYDTLDIHQGELWEMAADEIAGQLSSVFFELKIAEYINQDRKPFMSLRPKEPVTKRPLSRRIVFNDVDVQSNIVGNFDRMTIVLDAWLNAEEVDIEQSYSTIVK